ncbi:MAG: phosphoribosylformylglycinamidine synthase [Clostridiales bacterium]|jgi:phosphoribosylformylglycinamidine synthase|nr:phosphoribosylformylglycinamidine synthase [Clostridiales bacterium]
MIKRLFVEKKSDFDIESRELFLDLRDNLTISGLTSVKIVHRYDIEGITDDVYEQVKHTIFSEPPVDKVFMESYELNDGEYAFAVKYLPGQYDQRADSAEQCVKLLTLDKGAFNKEDSDKEGSGEVKVEAAKLYIFNGKLSEKDLKRIEDYCVNPVDSVKSDVEKPQSLRMNPPIPNDIENIGGFILKSEAQTNALAAEMGLAMTGADLNHCRKYFAEIERRDPSLTEIKVIDTYWSDHCRHTTFLTEITDIDIEDGPYANVFRAALNLYYEEKETDKPDTLMDIALAGMRSLRRAGKLTDLDSSDENNACSISVTLDTGEEWLVMFKNETHNHPTEIEPFGGAATCLGGAIRDPLSGRAYVYQAMRITGSGDPRLPVGDTLPGKLPQRKITTAAARGFSSYGNQIGLATGQVTEIYDEGYIAKRMEIGAVIGAAPKENVIRKKPVKGDTVILVGGRTGRDGCGGATGSSKEHNEDSLFSCGAEVQKGNPPTERMLQRLFRNPAASVLIKKCNDFGAGGVAVAIGELADGLDIDLDLVPKKYEGLDGTELAISESQERMAVMTAPENAEEFIRLANEENLEATIAARVTDDKRLVMRWRGRIIVNISREFLDTNGANQMTQAFIASPGKLRFDFNADKEIDFYQNLSNLSTACQKGLAERFDSTIGVGTVLMPFGGKYQLTPPEAMAAKIPANRGTNGGTTTITFMSFGFDPSISKRSPFHGAVYAITDALAKLVAAGCLWNKARLTLQEYFERVTSKITWGKPLAALLGAFWTQMKLGIPAIGGKDSMSGTFKDLHVPPTLVAFAVGTGKIRDVLSPEFKSSGNKLIRLNALYDENDLPDFEYLKNLFDRVDELNHRGLILSAATIGKGGLAATLAKMSVGNKIGAKIFAEGTEIYNERYGSIFLEVKEVKKSELEKLLDGLDYDLLGETTGENSIVIGKDTFPLAEIERAWLSPLESIFPTQYFQKPDSADSVPRALNLYAGKRNSSAKRIEKAKKFSAPRVLIPVFPGTNCEYDTATAFESAGGIVETLVIRNLKPEWLKDSIGRLTECIAKSQIIALPGGFSAGDEPEGSGKFIAAVFRNPYVKEAVTDLLNRRDGLILGICNGFQALIKLGLVPDGEISDLSESSPTLTYNTIGRHVSQMVHTKVVSTLSPWFWNTQPGDVHVIPVSHGEGRFIAPESLLRTLAGNNQIAAQYVDMNDNPSYDIRYNPNGSYWAIESITSPDGRVLGKMGHSERIAGDLYKNIPGQKDQGIFRAGVGYFTR